ncbi:putative membrane protein YedE/YeeE [Halorubrum alkaliphilum]|uniref:Putative membrane protein YedE/YeeE n=1 Tax=Halorubrum alkaliphilum TaxID=261290 RepID=A0A8T4GDA4_9EURY|nr:YeeE/YedE thiosulfate transporter family protein [Halorubrum alkaliphilum]MBP1922116.1 putative membrane protein YedE/YeeE [Halorubrum alkaliphilum]
MIAELLGSGTFEALFPNGISRYAVGGILVGLGTAIIYLGTGITAGASTFLESTLSYISETERFTQYRPSRDWRIVFTFGIVGGAAIYALTFQSGLVSSGLYATGTTGELRDVGVFTIWLTDVQPWRLFVGGILVGIGTRLGKGCTSGHGVCGVGSVSRTSLIGVVTFLIVAIVTANLVAVMGISP